MFRDAGNPKMYKYDFFKSPYLVSVMCLLTLSFSCAHPVC